jgi:competence protein ComEC
MTHPQRDHLQGLIAVLDRYDADYFIRSDIDNATEGYQELQDVIKKKNIPVKFATRGEKIDIGPTSISLLWPSREQIALFKRYFLASQGSTLQDSVLGSQTTDLNDGSIVFLLRYGFFDALFTGDADARVEENYRTDNLADDTLEVLKVPHHGSRTGMTDEFVRRLHPALAVISVGKNSYGHPAKEILDKLANVSSRVLRTDQERDIEVISDGRDWIVKTAQSK